MLFDLDKSPICRGSLIFRSEVEQIPVEYFPVLTLRFWSLPRRKRGVKTKEQKIKTYSLCSGSNTNSRIKSLDESAVQI